MNHNTLPTLVLHNRKIIENIVEIIKRGKRDLTSSMGGVGGVTETGVDRIRFLRTHELHTFFSLYFLSSSFPPYFVFFSLPSPSVILYINMLLQ